MTRPVDRAIVVSASAAVTDATAAAKRAFKVAHDNRSSTAVTRPDLQAVARHLLCSVTYTYQNNGQNVNLTGSPDYAAKIMYIGDPGKGCSDNPCAQFNTAAVTGPGYNSVGLESGRNILSSCPDKTVDLSIARNIKVGGARQLQFRCLQRLQPP
jgi:hypothetical protein